jgi:hypothetical protein
MWLPIIACVFFTIVGFFSTVLFSWEPPAWRWMKPLEYYISLLITASAVAWRQIIEIEASYDSDFRARCLGLIDSDIVGVGMRYSLFIQAVAVLTVILLGLFHGKPTGIKEIGAGILLSQAGITLSLAVHMADRMLNHLDAILGFIILNALIAGTTILLSTKEVLAARWMVYVATDWLYCIGRWTWHVAESDIYSNWIREVRCDLDRMG